MEYQEILVAAEVRRRMGEIRLAKRNSYEGTLSEYGDAKYAKMEKWDAENPLIVFLKPAYNELAFIAGEISDIRAEAELDARLANDTAAPKE